MLFTKNAMINYLKEYIKKRNLKILLPEETNFPPDIIENVDIIVREGDNIIFFSIFSITMPLEIARIRKIVNLELVKLSKLTNYANKVYLVMPKGIIKPHILDGMLFERSGVGLISIDNNGSFKEEIPAKPFERKRLFQIEYDKIEKRISLLESRIYELQKILNNYQKCYEELHNNINRLNQRISSIEERMNYVINLVQSSSLRITRPCEVTSLLAGEEVKIEVSKDLPSFVKNNPWLQVLSKRGKEE